MKKEITLTAAQRKAFLALRAAHGTGETIRTADAVETLVGEYDSLEARKRALETIIALGKTGALEYSPITDLLCIQEVTVVVPGEIPKRVMRDNPVVSPLHESIARLSPPRLRCLLAIIEIHEVQGGGPLPAHLPGRILTHMRNTYRHDTAMLVSVDKIRQFIYPLRDIGFLEDTGEHGVYRITPAGLELGPLIRKLARNRTATETPAANIPPETPETSE